MVGKVLLLAAAGAGYVLGARAGRERYEQISSSVGRLWGNPKVQSRVGDLEDKAGDLARQAGSAAQEKVGAAAGSVAGSVKDRISGGDAGNNGGSDGGDGAPLGDQHHTRMPTD
ncbi:YtxH domain-containing protein [Kineococcus sp. LSe6-4]|uniref:YtxH domain-containing protein n=1 Tax=Kineococcus halophytocola TaxID=3234027 RepID=A0ABV4H3L4_9ACTN